MRNVLIISKKKELGEALAKLIRPFRFDHIDLTDSAQDARRRIQKTDYDLAIINTPLAHELGTELAIDIIESDGPDVLLLVKGDALAVAEKRLQNAPVLVVQKPVNRQLMLRDLRFILNTRDKHKRLLEQNSKLRKKMEGLRLQFRAKLLIMDRLGMSEEEAHRYIQKKAMDERRTPGEVAEAIIRLYDNK